MPVVSVASVFSAHSFHLLNNRTISLSPDESQKRDHHLLIEQYRFSPSKEVGASFRCFFTTTKSFHSFIHGSASRLFTTKLKFHPFFSRRQVLLTLLFVAKIFRLLSRVSNCLISDIALEIADKTGVVLTTVMPSSTTQRSAKMVCRESSFMRKRQEYSVRHRVVGRREWRVRKGEVCSARIGFPIQCDHLCWFTPTTTSVTNSNRRKVRKSHLARQKRCKHRTAASVLFVHHPLPDYDQEESKEEDKEKKLTESEVFPLKKYTENAIFVDNRDAPPVQQRSSRSNLQLHARKVNVDCGEGKKEDDRRHTNLSKTIIEAQFVDDVCWEEYVVDCKQADKNNFDQDSIRQQRISNNHEHDIHSSNTMSVVKGPIVGSVLKNATKKCRPRRNIQFSEIVPDVIGYCVSDSEDEDELVNVNVSSNQDEDYDEKSEERAGLRALTDTNTLFNSKYSNFKIPELEPPAKSGPIKFSISSGHTRQPLPQPSKLKNVFKTSQPSCNVSIAPTSPTQKQSPPPQLSTKVRPMALPPNRPPPPPPPPVRQSSVEFDSSEKPTQDREPMSHEAKIQFDKIDLDKIRIPRVSIPNINKNGVHQDESTSPKSPLATFSKLEQPPATPTTTVKNVESCNQKQVIVLDSVGGSILTIQGNCPSPDDDVASKTSNSFEVDHHSKHDDSMSDSGSDSGASGLDQSRSPSSSPTQNHLDSAGDSSCCSASPDSLESALHESFGDNATLFDADNDDSLPQDKDIEFDERSAGQDVSVTVEADKKILEVVPLTSSEATDQKQFIHEPCNASSVNSPHSMTAATPVIASSESQTQRQAMLSNKTTISINYPRSGSSTVSSSQMAQSRSEGGKRAKMLHSLAADLEMHRSNSIESTNSGGSNSGDGTELNPPQRSMIKCTDPKFLQDCIADDTDEDSTPIKTKIFSFGKGKSKQIKSTESDSSDSDFEGLPDEIHHAPDSNEPPENDSDSELEDDEENGQKTKILKNKQMGRFFKDMTKKTSKFFVDTSKKIADKSKSSASDSCHFYPEEYSHCDTSQGQTKAFYVQSDENVTLKTDKKKKGFEGVKKFARNALRNFESKKKSSSSSLSPSQTVKSDNLTHEFLSVERQAQFRRLDSTDNQRSPDSSLATSTEFQRLDSSLESRVLSQTSFSVDSDAPPVAPIRRKKLAKKRQEITEPEKFEKYLNEIDSDLAHDIFQRLAQSNRDKLFFQKHRESGSTREFTILTSCDDLHWITCYDAMDQHTKTSGSISCRFLPEEFDQLSTVADFNRKRYPQTLVDSVTCQLFSVMAQYESGSRPAGRTIGDCKQALIATSSTDAILLVPIVPDNADEDDSDMEVGCMSMTQSYNVQYFCLAFMKTISRGNDTPYVQLQDRIKHRIAAPKDLYVLVGLDLFVSTKREEEIIQWFDSTLNEGILNLFTYVCHSFHSNIKAKEATDLAKRDFV